MSFKWPSGEEYSALRESYQDYIAMQTVFAKNICGVQDKYKSSKIQAKKAEDILDLLIKEHNNVGEVLNECKELIANKTI